MQKAFIVSGLAILHFFTERIAFFLTFAFGMNRFETGGSPAISERVLEAFSSVLQFPLVTLTMALPHPPPAWFYGPVEYVPFILNSLLWAAGIYFLLRWLGRSVAGKRKRMPAAAA